MNSLNLQPDAQGQAEATLARLKATTGHSGFMSTTALITPRMVLAKLTSRLKGLKLLPSHDIETHIGAIGNGIPAEAQFTIPYQGNQLVVSLYSVTELITRMDALVANKRVATDHRWYLPIGAIPSVDVEVWLTLDENSRAVVTYVTKDGESVFPGPLFKWYATISNKAPTLQSTSTMSTEVPSLEAIEETEYSNIKAVFDDHCKSVRFDRRWAKTVVGEIRAFEHRDEEHINFLGGNLVGVYRLHWRADDSVVWYNGLRIVDVPALKNDYQDLPTINPDFHVVGNPINASFLYAVHRTLTSDLAEKEKHETAVAILSHMHYQFLSSLLYHQFPYRAQEAIALAVYDSLSRKSMLKQYHTWGNLVRARAEDIIGKNSIHYKTLIEFTNDEKIIYAISDIQSRIREVVKKLKGEYMRLRDQDSRVMSQSTTLVNREGETILRDFENKAASLQRELKDIVRDPHDLIRDEVVESTLKIVTTADERYLRTALLYLSEASEGRDRQTVHELIDVLVIFIQGYLRRAPASERTLIHVVLKVRNLMRSSQLTVSDAIVIRNLASDLIESALPKRNSAVQASTRIAMLVYLTIRLLTINHFK